MSRMVHHRRESNVVRFEYTMESEVRKTGTDPVGEQGLKARGLEEVERVERETLE